MIFSGHSRSEVLELYVLMCCKLYPYVNLIVLDVNYVVVRFAIFLVLLSLLRVSDTSWFCSLCHFLEFCRWLKWCGMVWYPDGLVSLVACTNASLVHATWLTRTIRVVAVSNLSMRHKVNWTKTILCLLREELQAVAIRGNKWRRGFGILLWN